MGHAMKNYMITIDGGTTNTRVALWNEKKELIYAAKAEVGVRDAAKEGNSSSLKTAISSMVKEMMQGAEAAHAQVNAVYACGMLTSNVGILEVPHLTAPAGLREFAKGVEDVLMPDICSIPISFIPGMKNFSGEVGRDNLEQMDIMRGEETETIALMELCKSENSVTDASESDIRRIRQEVFPQEALYVLPGSHTKFVSVNGKGQMTGCLTSMAGELLFMLTCGSVLTDAVKGQFAPETYDREMFIAGAKETWATSLSRAIFLTRIVNQFMDGRQEACSSFLMGAVLATDILAVKRSRALTMTKNTKVVIAGKEPLKSALKELFIQDGTFKEVTAFQNEEHIPLSGYGMCVIAEKRACITRVGL